MHDNKVGALKIKRKGIETEILEKEDLLHMLNHEIYAKANKNAMPAVWC